MDSIRSKPTTVAEYIADADKPARAKLRQIRACIKKAAPGSTEELKWGMPSYSYRRILVIYGAFKNHIGFFPGPPVMKAMAKELKGYKTAKASIQFPLDQPLPLALVRKLTLLRVKQEREKDQKWRT